MVRCARIQNYRDDKNINLSDLQQNMSDTQPGSLKRAESNEIVLFGMQSFVTLFMLSFSAYMIATSKENMQIFLPIMTSVSAYWLPAPRIPSKLLYGIKASARHGVAPKTDAKTKKNDDNADIGAVPDKTKLALGNTDTETV